MLIPPPKNQYQTPWDQLYLLKGGRNLDFGKNRIEFGAYTMVYVGTHKNMKKRIIPEVVLKVSNEDGGYFFMSLYSVKRLHSFSS